MAEITQKHHKQGSDLPPTTKNHLRVYSMRFCPYAYRTRLVLAHKNIPHEIVNVHLGEKPDWFLARNPRGLVPTLEINDQIMYESSIINEYLDEKYKDKALFPTDTFVKAKSKVLMSHFDSWAVNMYKLYRLSKTLSDEEKAKISETMQKDLRLLEDALGEKSYFGGQETGILDYHVWPHLEQHHYARTKLQMPEYEMFRQLITVERFPNITKWMGKMLEHPVVKKTTMGKDAHMKYIETAQSGKTDPDIGLQEE